MTPAVNHMALQILKATDIVCAFTQYTNHEVSGSTFNDLYSEASGGFVSKIIGVSYLISAL